MANKTKCQTDGAIYKITIKSKSIESKVTIPFELELTEEEASILETNIHNMLEIVLKPYFMNNKKTKILKFKEL